MQAGRLDFEVVLPPVDAAGRAHILSAAQARGVTYAQAAVQALATNAEGCVSRPSDC